MCLVLTVTMFQMGAHTSPNNLLVHSSTKRRETVVRWRTILEKGLSIPQPPETVWSPKHPVIKWPSMFKEKKVSRRKWKQSNFPHRILPDTVSGQVSVKVWNAKIEELSSQDDPPQGLISIMKDVAQQLINGASSRVNYPGTVLTSSKNIIPQPREQIPRIIDALASFTSKGHMAGPLFDVDAQSLKINPIMAVKKPGGHIRVVGNLKHPSGYSFNEGIAEEEKDIWPVEMTNAKDVASMILDAGQGAWLACTDMKDAYKMIPVDLSQRKLQAYSFCGAIFIELKLIFGDKLACLFFDRLHYCILNAFVYPEAPMHKASQGRTVDDIPSVVPEVAEAKLRQFVKTYRCKLKCLNIEAADNDPTCTKAFDMSQEGEVLGTRFNTNQLTWSMPHDKLYRLITQLRRLAEGKTYSLRDLESIVGKLNYISGLCPPLLNFLGTPIQAISEHLEEWSVEGTLAQEVDRDLARFTPSQFMKQDLLMVAAILVDSFENPLPIMRPDPTPPLSAVPVYTDASGKINGVDVPSLGIFFPPFDGMYGAAFSIPFSRDFLLQSNGTGLVADTTTTLEALGVLASLAIHPHRLAGREVHFRIDNVAVVYSFRKRRSNDRLANTIIRASYLVAGALNCKLFVTWSPRRSSRSTCVADDLTHGDFQSAYEYDRKSVLYKYNSFPPPIETWMEKAVERRDLGHDVLFWMKCEFGKL